MDDYFWDVGKRSIDPISSLSLSLVDRMAMHIYFRNDEVCISFLLLLPVP